MGALKKEKTGKKEKMAMSRKSAFTKVSSSPVARLCRTRALNRARSEATDS